MQLVLNTYGLQLSQRNHCFQVEAKTGNRIISPARVSSILVTKNINISSSAIMLAAENNIPIVLLDNTGNPAVKINPVLSAGLTALRKKQLLFSPSKAALGLVKKMLLQKTEGQLVNLAFWANRKTGSSGEIGIVKEKMISCVEALKKDVTDYSTIKAYSDFLRGWEANVARWYWQAVSALATAEGLTMKGRTYRPAGDECNAALNYLYGMLYNQVETALASAGLDSQIGLWHRDEHQTPSLAFDVIEPFRPKADRVLIELLMRNGLQASWFEPSEKYGYLVNRQGRIILINAFNSELEARIKMNDKVTAFKNHILQMAYYLKSEIEKNTGDE